MRSAAELAAAVRAREESAAEVVEEHITRVELLDLLDPLVNAVGVDPLEASGGPLLRSR
jgi:hypothetical protein